MPSRSPSASAKWRRAEVPPRRGLHDRVIFRELFPIGLTALDPIEEAMRTGALSTSQQSARREIEELLTTLQLPERGTGLAHLQARHDGSTVSPASTATWIRGH